MVVQVRCLILSSPLNPTAPDSRMQTPTPTATTQERRQGANPIAVQFQQQSGPPSIGPVQIFKVTGLVGPFFGWTVLTLLTVAV